MLANLSILTLIIGTSTTWYLFTHPSIRTYPNNQDGINPFDTYSILLQWITASLVGFFCGFILFDTGLTGGFWEFISSLAAALAVGGFFIGLLLATISGLTIPFPGYRRPWWKEIYVWHRANHQSTKNLSKAASDPTITPNPRALADANKAAALRSFPLPSQAATEDRQPVAFEHVSWSLASSDQARLGLAPYNNKEKLRLRGTITGPFTFTGVPPENVQLLRGFQKFYPVEPNLVPTRERVVDLIVDHRVVVAAQVHEEDFVRRHNWVFGVVNIGVEDMVFGVNEGGVPTLSFGVGDESFVFTPSGRSVRKLTVERVEDAMLDRGFAGLGVFLPDGGNIGGVSDLVVEDTVVAVQGELEYYTLVPAYGEEDRRLILDAVDRWEAERAGEES